MEEIRGPTEVIPAMTNPNAIVEGNGEKVTLNRLTDPVLNSMNELDEGASTFESVLIDAVVSDLSEEDLTRLEGRVENPSLKITVDSNTDISADRDIRPDRVKYDGRIYEVAEVRRMDHPFADAEKVTATLATLPGRPDLNSV